MMDHAIAPSRGTVPADSVATQSVPTRQSYAQHMLQFVRCLRALAEYYRVLRPDQALRGPKHAARVVQKVLLAAERASPDEAQRVIAVLMNPLVLDLGVPRLAHAHRRYAQDPDLARRVNDLRRSEGLAVLPLPADLPMAVASWPAHGMTQGSPV